MKHTSEKSKHEAWRLGTRCDGDVIEKSKWMLNSRNQASLKGSHIFEY
jgi:hypothetical protein